MTPESILHQCRALGIAVVVKDDRLQLQAVKGGIPDTLLNSIKEYKYILIDYLLTTDPTCSTCPTYPTVSGGQVVNDRPEIGQPEQQLAQAHTPRKVEQVGQVEQVVSDQVEAFEERAAIMEFDGGLSRVEAERQARIICRRTT